MQNLFLKILEEARYNSTKNKLKRNINAAIMTIHIKNPQEIEKMRVAGKLASEVLDFITPFVKPGITTEEIDKLCHDYMVNVQNTIPAPLNYAPDGHTPYPKSICTSINHVVCHGIPNDKTLNDGDIINIDITAILDGYYGDTSKTFSVGEISIKAERLIRITYESMMEGIKILKPGINLGDIGFVIQSYAESNGCSVVRDFCGHGVGKTFHEEPNILHYGKKGEGIKIKKGMVFTIEPMINLGEYHTKVLPDGWTAVTKDKSLSAQFEHTVGITNNGYEIFTL
mgnify:CR=1 FL=1